MTRARCRTLPSDWWDTGDDGNRLALMLCRSCPVLEHCGQSRGEAGVIRAGVAYGETGKVLPLCACGYPNLHQPGWNAPANVLCHRCAVPKLRRWNPSRKTYWARRWQQRRRAKIGEVA